MWIILAPKKTIKVLIGNWPPNPFILRKKQQEENQYQATKTGNTPGW